MSSMCLGSQASLCSEGCNPSSFLGFNFFIYLWFICLTILWESKEIQHMREEGYFTSSWYNILLIYFNLVLNQIIKLFQIYSEMIKCWRVWLVGLLLHYITETNFWQRARRLLIIVKFANIRKKNLYIVNIINNFMGVSDFWWIYQSLISNENNWPTNYKMGEVYSSTLFTTWYNLKLNSLIKRTFKILSLQIVVDML